MELELVDVGFSNADGVESAGYSYSAVGYGENFVDSVNDAISVVSDLTNIPAGDIMDKVMEKYPNKFTNVIGPANTIDSAPVGAFYSVVLRLSC